MNSLCLRTSLSLTLSSSARFIVPLFASQSLSPFLSFFRGSALDSWKRTNNGINYSLLTRRNVASHSTRKYNNINNNNIIINNNFTRLSSPYSNTSTTLSRFTTVELARRSIHATTHSSPYSSPSSSSTSRINHETKKERNDKN